MFTTEQKGQDFMESFLGDSLAHYGVLGMKWGVRKKESKDRIARGKHTSRSHNPDYSKKQRDYDKKHRGRRSVKRINKQLNSGKTLQEARKSEDDRATIKAALGLGTVVFLSTPAGQRTLNLGLRVVGKTIQFAGGKIVGAATAKATARGAKAASDILSDSRGITSYKTIALNLDKASGIWR